jgi:uracil-DNA glycosylase family 4
MGSRLYLKLVQKRRACRLCPDLANPATVDGGRFDTTEHIGPWSRWQGNLSPKLLVVGQEWADQKTFRRCQGRDDAHNRTNATLLTLIRSIGVAIDPDHDGGQAPVFLTNAVLCLKDGTMQAPVKERWFVNCSPFLKATIDLLKPRVVVSLGWYAYESIRRLYSLEPRPLREAVDEQRPYRLADGVDYFAMYHCGAWVLNRTRPLTAQIRDWERIRRSLV